jgi:hypothetical protein
MACVGTRRLAVKVAKAVTAAPEVEAVAASAGHRLRMSASTSMPLTWCRAIRF